MIKYITYNIYNQDLQNDKIALGPSDQQGRGIRKNPYHPVLANSTQCTAGEGLLLLCAVQRTRAQACQWNHENSLLGTMAFKEGAEQKQTKGFVYIQHLSCPKSGLYPEGK